MLPNIQLPRLEDIEAIKRFQDADEVPVDLIREMRRRECLCEDPDLHSQPDWPDRVWWGKWRSKNQQSVLELLRGYFAFMGFQFPHEEQIISPRVAPEPLLKTSLFVNNNEKLYPKEQPQKKKKRKKKGKSTASSPPPEPEESADDQVTSIPFEYTSLFRWKYCHENHSIQNYIQEDPKTIQFHKIMIEDPVEKGRLLQPFRSRAHPQTILEFIRGFLILQGGLGLDELFNSWLPINKSSLTLDMDVLKHTDYYHALAKRSLGKAEDIINCSRHEIVWSFLSNFPSGDILPGAESDMLDLRSLWDFWDQPRAARLAKAWLREEENFKDRLQL